MSKEYLEALKTIKIKCHPNSNPSPVVDEALEVVEQALQRLEFIDNANPSKALERLYCSGNLQLNYVLSDKHKHDYETIEQALQRLESIDNANPSKALDCLFRLGHNHRKDYINGKHKEDYSIVEQALLKAQENEKVLSIINKKSVYIHLLQQCGDVESYNNYFITKYGLDEFTERLLLTQEEFDLLKRLLRNA